MARPWKAWRTAHYWLVRRTVISMGTVAMKKTRRVERYSGERVEQDARDMRLGQRMHTRASRVAACSWRPLVGKSFSKASPSSSPPSWRWPYISALLREKTTQISQRGQGKFNQLGSERDRAALCAVPSSSSSSCRRLAPYQTLFVKSFRSWIRYSCLLPFSSSSATRNRKKLYLLQQDRVRVFRSDLVDHRSIDLSSMEGSAAAAGGGGGGGGESKKKEESLPPGFRFHPTDEELITYYLRQKIADGSFTARAIAEVDLNKCEPWDLPGKDRSNQLYIHAHIYMHMHTHDQINSTYKWLIIKKLHCFLTITSACLSI